MMLLKSLTFLQDQTDDLFYMSYIRQLFVDGKAKMC